MGAGPGPGVQEAANSDSPIDGFMSRIQAQLIASNSLIPITTDVIEKAHIKSL